MTTRTAATWITSLLLPVLAGIALAVPALTHDAPEGGFSHMSPVEALQYAEVTDAKPVNEPTWDSHGGEAGCSPLRDGEVAGVVLVVTQGGDVVRMDFDKAWGLAQDDERANDVWTIGRCS